MNSKKNEKTLSPKQARRREQILKATEQLILRNGYEGTSMREIAREADVTEMTLYNIYGSKAELVALFFTQRTADSFARAIRAKPKGGLPFLKSLIQEIVESSLQLPKVAREGVSVMLAHPKTVLSDKLFITHVGAALHEMNKEGLLDTSALSVGVARLIGHGFLTSQALWAHGVITDDELRPYLELQLYQAMMQYATPQEFDRYRQLTRRITKKLGPKRLRITSQ